MFLLFLPPPPPPPPVPEKFTFQYVSIISLTLPGRKWKSLVFTFQYVSIISRIADERVFYISRFTFQYVSIISFNCCVTATATYHLHSNMFLLFPN